MTNTTPEYWDVDGTSLQTYARNIESWGDSRQGVAPLRGGDQVIPYVPGELWTPKVPGPRVITLAGWVIGADDAGVYGTDPHLTLGDNWRALRNLLWRTDRQVLLTKRWKDAGGTVHSGVARAEYQGGLEPTMQGSAGAKFTVDMNLAFPYFQGAVVDTGLQSGFFNITNSGDDTTRMITLVFTAGATLTNNSTGRALTVPAAATLIVDQFVATGNYENITVSGQPSEGFWMSLVRGNNSFMLSAGSVGISYTPLYL